MPFYLVSVSHHVSLTNSNGAFLIIFMRWGHQGNWDWKRGWDIGLCCRRRNGWECKCWEKTFESNESCHVSLLFFFFNSKRNKIPYTYFLCWMKWKKDWTIMSKKKEKERERIWGMTYVVYDASFPLWQQFDRLKHSKLEERPNEDTSKLSQCVVLFLRFMFIWIWIPSNSLPPSLPPPPSFFWVIHIQIKVPMHNYIFFNHVVFSLGTHLDANLFVEGNFDLQPVIGWSVFRSRSLQLVNSFSVEESAQNCFL